MSRPTILLLHAFPLDSRMWASQRDVLEEAGYTVAAPDLPGREESGFGAWAERVLDDVAGDFIPVGISMGGYLTFELWRRASERIPALVLADTRATPDTPEQRQGREETIGVLEEEGFDRFWEDLAPKLFSKRTDRGVVAAARAIAAEQEVAHLVAALLTLRDREDSRPTLATIDAPALVIVGEEDALTPPTDAADVEEGIRQARLVQIANAGHLTPLERPHEVDEALLSFLDEVAP